MSNKTVLQLLSEWIELNKQEQHTENHTYLFEYVKLHRLTDKIAELRAVEQAQIENGYNAGVKYGYGNYDSIDYFNDTYKKEP